MRVEYHDQRVFLYEVQPGQKQMIQMRKGAEILGLSVKNGLAYIIAAVPTNEIENVPRIFRAVTTGQRFNREVLFYVGSVRLGGNGNEPWYSLHLFEYETALLPSSNPEIEDTRFSDDTRELKNEIEETV